MKHDNLATHDVLIRPFPNDSAATVCVGYPDEVLAFEKFAEKLVVIGAGFPSGYANWCPRHEDETLQVIRP